RVTVDTRQRRRGADASTIVERFSPAVDGAAVDVGAEKSATGDEEGTPLVEKAFVSGKIEHRRIGLDLSEVRIDRRVERHVRSDAVLHVSARRQIRLLRKLIVDDGR